MLGTGCMSRLSSGACEQTNKQTNKNKESRDVNRMKMYLLISRPYLLLVVQLSVFEEPVVLWERQGAASTAEVQQNIHGNIQQQQLQSSRAG